MNLDESEYRKLAELLRSDILRPTVEDYAQKLDEHLIAYQDKVEEKEEVEADLREIVEEIPDEFKNDCGDTWVSVREMVITIKILRKKIEGMGGDES